MDVVLDPSQELEIQENQAEQKCFFEQIRIIEKRIEDLLKLKEQLIIDILEAQKRLQDLVCEA